MTKIRCEGTTLLGGFATVYVDDVNYTPEYIAAALAAYTPTKMADNIIHLAFRSPHMASDTMSFISCRACKNKTYTLVEDNPEYFPLMKCAACGQHMGRMGWYHDE